MTVAARSERTVKDGGAKQRQCRECGSAFPVEHHRKAYCSIACKEKGYRKSAKQRSRQFRERAKETIRRVPCNIDIAPGLVLIELEVTDALAEDWLVKTGKLRDFEADFPQLVDEALKVYTATRYSGAHAMRDDVADGEDPE